MCYLRIKKINSRYLFKVFEKLFYHSKSKKFRMYFFQSIQMRILNNFLPIYSNKCSDYRIKIFFTNKAGHLRVKKLRCELS